MDPESRHELIFAYALDALDDDDRMEFEEHLALCAQCAAALPGLRITVAGLAHDVAPVSPRPRLRRRLLRRVRRDGR